MLHNVRKKFVILYLFLLRIAIVSSKYAREANKTGQFRIDEQISHIAAQYSIIQIITLFERNARIITIPLHHLVSIPLWIQIIME